MTVTVQHSSAADISSVTAIYNHYIEQSVATFEENVLSTAEVASRVEKVTDASLPWLVAKDPQVIGYAYARPWHERSAYRFTVETSVYVAPKAQGRRIGTRLYETLLQELRTRGLRTAIGGVSLPNPASVALHDRLGFAKVAHFRQVGFKFGEWIDVGYWQVELSR